MKQKLNVLFLCSWYPSRVLPSNGDFIQRHAQAVATQHKVIVFHIITDEKCLQKIEFTDKVIENVRTIIAYIKPTKNRFLKALLFRKAQNELLKKVAVIDVVHVHKLFPMGLFALKIKRRLKVPFIVTEHHSIYKKPFNKSIGKFEKNLSKLIAKKAAFICPVSQNLGNAMQNFGLKGQYKKVPNVVDVTQFIPKEKQLNVFKILHVSNMVTLKNVSGILRVIKQLDSKIDNFHFYCIGGTTKKYNQEAKDLGIKSDTITFKNQVPHNEIVTYFQEANVFVLFSNTENQPCVIPEAFACGTPVISTNVGGVSEYFPDEFGELIEPKNEVQLMHAILKIHTNFEKKSSKFMHNYVVNTFGTDVICESFTKLYLKSMLD
ncbi:MAG: glycosyltransferase family 4 protein [Flavobacteriaceae bacterium]